MNVNRLMLALTLGLLAGCSLPMSDQEVLERRAKCERWPGYKLKTWIHTEGPSTGWVAKTRCVKVGEEKEE